MCACLLTVDIGGDGCHPNNGSSCPTTVTIPSHLLITKQELTAPLAILVHCCEGYVMCMYIDWNMILG